MPNGHPIFWCGRQELKTCDDTKKALIFKAFFAIERQRGRQNFFEKNYGIACLFIIK